MRVRLILAWLLAVAGAGFTAFGSLVLYSIRGTEGAGLAWIAGGALLLMGLLLGPLGGRLLQLVAAGILGGGLALFLVDLAGVRFRPF